ncbi:MAG: DUF4493 domain-containing protein [Rikenellaceae bacterium]
MKIFIVSVFMVAAALVQGCALDNVDFAVSDNVVNPGEIIDPNSNGYLQFGNALSIEVERESEEFNDKESGDYTEVKSTTTRTTTLSDAPGSYIVVIKNDTTGEVVYEDSYDAVKALTAPLTLPAAIYTVQAKSNLTYMSPVWDAPEYESPALTVVVADEKVVTIEELTCKLATIKTQVSVSADMMELFDTSATAATPFAITLSYGGEKLTFEKDETRSGFFAPQSGVSTIDVELQGMYNVAEDGEPASYTAITWKQTITSVMGGQSRYISVKIDNYNSGKVQFKFEVQTWAYDAPLGVDITSGTFYEVGSAESEIYDKDSETTDAGAPVVTLAEGLSVGESYVVSQLMMNLENKTYDPTYSFAITPQEGAKLASVELVTRSTSNTLLDAIATLGNKFDIVPTWSVAQGFDTLFDGYFSGAIYDSANGVLNATLRYEAIEFINTYKGTHEVVVKATDDQGRISHTSLSFLSIIAGGPEIVWRGDYSFEDIHEISAADANLPVVIDIESATGITSMDLTITSDVLTPEELSGIGLQQEMDLVNPGSCGDGLTALGFPTGDEVENQKSLVLDISSFMPMLAGLGAGRSDFEIVVGDASGKRAVTIQILVK